MYEKTLKLLKLHKEKTGHKKPNNTYYNGNYSFTNDAIRVNSSVGWHIILLYNNKFNLLFYTKDYMLEKTNDGKTYMLLDYSNDILKEIPYETTSDEYFQLNLLYPDIEMVHKLAMKFNNEETGITIDMENIEKHIDNVLDMLENDPVLEAWSRCRT